MSYRFVKLLEGATDQVLVEPNWEGILECVDMIRGGEIPVKEALKTIQKRYHNPNPHIAHHALLVLEACVKNCGKKFIAEIATMEFMDDFKNLVISTPQENVRTKILELIQCWSSAFKGIPEYKIVGDTHSLLKMNGFEFPPIDEAKAMFLAESAPDWAEGDNCYRCRVEFGVFTRKHHCRACGQIFCDRCSCKQMLLPQFGIEKKVRVCEACFEKKQAQPTTKGQTKTPLEAKAAEESAAREKALKEAQAKEQEELDLALAISQSEAEAKEQEKRRSLYNAYNGANVAKNGNSGWNSTATGGWDTNVSKDETNVASGWIGYSGVAQSRNGPAFSSNNNVQEDVPHTSMADDLQDSPFDSVLAKYLDRDYWERKRKETEEQANRAAAATAPPPSEISVSVSSSISQRQQNGLKGINNNNFGSTNAFAQNETSMNFMGSLEAEQQTLRNGGCDEIDEMSRNYAKLNIAAKESTLGALEGEEEVAETSQFCRILKEQVDTMNTRMKSNHLRGRSIVNDSAIHSLFSQLTDLHATVLQRMTKLEEQREHYERLQDHLAHIQEARQAINALREENERQRQDRLKEEQSRRQIQMRQKLELMRHKKHEMLMNERYAAIQRFQEQERQIRQQRMPQQQSPLTVGAQAGIDPGVVMPPIVSSSIPVTGSVGMQTPPTAQNQQQINSAQVISPQLSTASPHQSQFIQPPQQLATSIITPMPSQMVSSYSGHSQPAIVGMPPYSSIPPPISTPHQQLQQYAATPMMFAAPYHHPLPMPMTTTTTHGIPPMQPQFHHQMPPYQQAYVPAHHQMPIHHPHSMQTSGTVPPPQEQQNEERKEVAEDLLISFD